MSALMKQSVSCLAERRTLYVWHMLQPQFAGHLGRARLLAAQEELRSWNRCTPRADGIALNDSGVADERFRDRHEGDHDGGNGTSATAGSSIRAEGQPPVIPEPLQSIHHR
jgi:hypothetical protein